MPRQIRIIIPHEAKLQFLPQNDRKDLRSQIATHIINCYPYQNKGNGSMMYVGVKKDEHN